MTEREQIEVAITALEAHRSVLGEAVVQTAILALRKQLAELETTTEHQRRLVTVLFVDVVDSTRITQGLEPEDIITIMDGALRYLSNIIHVYDGRVTRFMGDGFKAVFGIPVARENDAERAVRAGLDLLTAAKQYAQDIEANWGRRGFNIRVGINTGLVATGGFSEGQDTVMGLTVNLAARLEHEAPAGALLISHYTYRHVRGMFEVEKQEAVSVKGFAQTIPIYTVTRAKPHTFHVQTRGVEGVETRLIGRDEELAHLKHRFREAVTDNLLQVVTVVGEAGIGKTRLLDEFENWCVRLPKALSIFNGRSTQAEGQRPFALIRDLFLFYFQIQDSDSMTQARQKLEDGFVALVGKSGRERAHFIGQLVGLDFSQSPHIQGIIHDTSQIHDLALYHAAQFFRKVATIQPIVIFLEDMQWADESSLDFIDYLVFYCAELPIMVVCSARYTFFEKRPSWHEAWFAYTPLELEALPPLYSLTLIREILHQVVNVPALLEEMVIERAEGNPFYVEEILKMMIEDGVIVVGENQWHVLTERLVHVRIPSTLIGVLQTRLDRLSMAEYEILQCAAVIGRVFWSEAILACFLQGHQQNVQMAKTIEKALLSLLEKELIVQHQPASFADLQEYAFKQTILHGVVYEGVLKSRRRQYHAQAAVWLLKQSGERTNEYAGLIAAHYENAGQSAYAAEWYGRAAQLAQDSYAAATAIQFYEKAINLFDLSMLNNMRAHIRDLHAKIDWYLGLGRALRRQARYKDAVAAFNNMLATATGAGDVLSQAIALNGLSFALSLQGNHREAVESGQRAEELVSTLPSTKQTQTVIMRSLYERGFAYYRLGQVKSALELGERALSLSILYFEQGHMARSLNLLGSVHQSLGHYDRAAHYHKQALLLSQSAGDRRSVGMMLNNLGDTALLGDDYEAAVTYYEDSLAIFQEIGDRGRSMALRVDLAGARIRLGDYEVAVAELQIVLQAVSDAWYKRSETYRYLAAGHWGLGDGETAVLLATQALSAAHRTGSLEDLGNAWYLLAQLAAQANEVLYLEEKAYVASDCFGEALRIFSESNMIAERGRVLWDWSQYERRYGDRASSQTMMQKARVIFEKLKMAHMLAEMEVVKAEG